MERKIHAHVGISLGNGRQELELINDHGGGRPKQRGVNRKTAAGAGGVHRHRPRDSLCLSSRNARIVHKIVF